MRLTAAVCLLGLLSAGCRSTNTKGPEEPTPWVSVVLQGNTPGQISAVTEQVFRENDYRVTQARPPHLIFEKQAGGFNNIVYGNWGADSPVWLRIRADIVQVSETGFRLQCKASLVRDPGATLEEELKYTRPRRQPVQALLDEVARRFHQQPDAASPELKHQ